MSRKSTRPASKRNLANQRHHLPRVPGGRSRPPLVVCILLGLLVLLVFGRTLSFSFLDFDDGGNVSENPFVQRGLSFQGIGWAFTHTQVGDWLPLTALSHMLDCQLFGLWAGGHHLANVLLHAATAVCLFLVLRQMTAATWKSALVAALFAVHPLRAESVAWISERKDVLSGLFFMLTLGAYAAWTRQPERGRKWVLLFLCLGLLSKTMLVTAPLVFLLLDFWPLKRWEGNAFERLLLEKLPFLILCTAAAIGQLIAARNGIGSLASYPLPTRLANAVVSLATYVLRMFWPAQLAGFYPYPRHGIAPLAVGAALLLVVGVSAATFRWRRRAPWLLLGWLWYLIMLLPVLGLLQTGEVSHADRYTYLPQIGLYVAIVWAAGAWMAAHPGQKTAAACLASAVVLTLTIAGFRQTGFWRDSETMWNRALACTVDNDTAHYNLGTSRLKAGQIDEAILHFNATLDANPAYADAHINLGRALIQKAHPDEAISHYQQALEIQPRYPEAHFNLGVLLLQQGRSDEAIAHYQQAIAIKPDYFEAHNNLGSALLKAGRSGEAILQYEAALRIEPDSAAAHNNLATALAQNGRIQDAIAHFQKALRIDPNHAKACNSYAWLLSTTPEPALRDGHLAVELATRANKLTGDNQPAFLRTLAAAFAEDDRFDDALHFANRALELAKSQAGGTLASALSSDIESYKAHRPLR